MSTAPRPCCQENSPCSRVHPTLLCLSVHANDVTSKCWSVSRDKSDAPHVIQMYSGEQKRRQRIAEGNYDLR